MKRGLKDVFNFYWSFFIDVISMKRGLKVKLTFRCTMLKLSLLDEKRIERRVNCSIVPSSSSNFSMKRGLKDFSTTYFFSVEFDKLDEKRIERIKIVFEV